MLRPFAIALCNSIVLVAIAPNLALAGSVSTALDNGTVSIGARLNYQEAQNFLRNLQLQITRNQQTLAAAALPVQQLPGYNRRRGFNASDTELMIIDLDSNGEPEIVVDVAEAGANCCSSSFIYSYNPQSRQYIAQTQFWGHYTSGYWLSSLSGEPGDRKLADIDNDGFYEFAALDDRFRGKFGSFAASFAPIQIWRYQEGSLKNVTKEFPYFLALSAGNSWEAYQRIRSENGVEAAQGAMAAYVGAMFLLGQQDEAMQQLQQAYGGDSSGQRFITQLLSFLRQAGYASNQQSVISY
jgi:hypothetical protein